MWECLGQATREVVAEYVTKFFAFHWFVESSRSSGKFRWRFLLSKPVTDRLAGHLLNGNSWRRGLVSGKFYSQAGRMEVIDILNYGYKRTLTTICTVLDSDSALVLGTDV